jgi:DNA polymerase
MGAVKFQTQLQNMGHRLDIDTCKHIIKQYRQANTRISGWWNHLNTVLNWLLTNKASDQVDARRLLAVSPFTGIELPSGMFINYPELKLETAGGYSYMTRQGRNRLYGGKVAENLCQAVARCVIGEQMLMIEKELRVVLTVHDAIACVVPESQAGEAQAFIEDCMRTPPKWAEGLPLNCESGMAHTYGDC